MFIKSALRVSCKTARFGQQEILSGSLVHACWQHYLDAMSVQVTLFTYDTIRRQVLINELK